MCRAIRSPGRTPSSRTARPRTRPRGPPASKPSPPVSASPRPPSPRHRCGAAPSCACVDGAAPATWSANRALRLSLVRPGRPSRGAIRRDVGCRREGRQTGLQPWLQHAAVHGGPACAACAGGRSVRRKPPPSYKVARTAIARYFVQHIFFLEINSLKRTETSKERTKFQGMT